jgi:hypothetical protein
MTLRISPSHRRKIKLESCSTPHIPSSYPILYHEGRLHFYVERQTQTETETVHPTTESRSGFTLQTSYSTARPLGYAYSQVLTEGHKKCLGRSRLAARSRHLLRCQCAVSLARSGSTLHFRITLALSGSPTLALLCSPLSLLYVHGTDLHPLRR